MYRLLILLLLSFPMASTPTHKQMWVEIHDASPGYGTERLDEVIKILERHDVDKKVIFVIPNHNNVAPLSKYPDFASYLEEKEMQGYLIGAHGYTHEGFEFYCSRERAEELIEASKVEFRSHGLTPKIFYPPRYLVSDDSLEVLKNNYDEIYLLNNIVKGNRTLPYFDHEFTWFNVDHRVTLPIAKLFYLGSRREVFRLGVHIGAVNNPENLRFLDEFLAWTDRING
ncbi:MAG: DUF2334 domain-containing protein [Candidatus Hydrothermarchaeales archaeon]